MDTKYSFMSGKPKHFITQAESSSLLHVQYCVCFEHISVFDRLWEGCLLIKCLSVSILQVFGVPWLASGSHHSSFQRDAPSSVRQEGIWLSCERKSVSVGLTQPCRLYVALISPSKSKRIHIQLCVGAYLLVRRPLFSNFLCDFSTQGMVLVLIRETN